LSSRAPHAPPKAKHAAAREAISGVCSRRKLGPLLVALGGGHQLGLPSDDDAVTKGEAREVSRDRRSLGYIVVFYVAQQLSYEPHFVRKVSQNQALARDWSASRYVRAIGFVSI